MKMIFHKTTKYLKFQHDFFWTGEGGGGGAVFTAANSGIRQIVFCKSKNIAKNSGIRQHILCKSKTTHCVLKNVCVLYI